MLSLTVSCPITDALRSDVRSRFGMDYDALPPVLQEILRERLMLSVSSQYRALMMAGVSV